MNNQRILIVGGGPAGLALAVALRERGVSSTLVERRTWNEIVEERSSGYDLSPSGARCDCHCDTRTQR